MIASKTLKLLVAAISLLFAAACYTDTGGDTEPNLTSQAIQTTSPNTVYLFRDTGFSGALVTMNVMVNGQKAGALNAGKMLKINVPRGNVTLTVQSIGAGPMNAPGIATFNNNGKAPHFFTVGLKQNLVGTEIQLIETTASSFLAQIR